jgi:carboxylate-amine ligase
LGVEEEFHLVDLRTRRLTPRAGQVLSALEGSSYTYAAELQQTTVETNSNVAETLDELRRNLVAQRSELVRAAETLGIGIAGAGTMPLSVPLRMTETARFRRMLADYQVLVREQLICGMQVHVGITERDLAAVLIGRVSPWLPPLLALSASSPFSHDGQDTGYASSRSLIWSRWPTTGSAGTFTSAAAYDAHVQNLIASGVISDSGMIYFDVRPSAHLPTIEMRVCDACPSVDTVVLIAGLFRAVVMRELTLHQQGKPSQAVTPALQRAAMWRASRSGLEGELVDLTGPRSVPAGVLLRAMVEELRPELDADRCWSIVRDLGEAALAQGSAAARQRETLRRQQRITDVVDLIVGETRAKTPFHEAAETALRQPHLEGYDPGDGFDEAVLPDGRPRASHAAVIDVLGAMTPSRLRERNALLEQQKVAAGVVFRPTDQTTASTFPIDFVPRVLTGEEWSRLQGGTAQRARALDAFVADVYGERAVLREGIVPAALVNGCPSFRAAGQAPPARARRIQVSGFDIVRDGDGRWLVLEDNVRVPSGVAYAIQNRRLEAKVFPELTALAPLLDPEAAPRLLRRTLEESAPPRMDGSVPHVVLLGAGPGDSAYFEHRMLADAMELPALVCGDLLVEDDIVWQVAKERRQRVDVIYLRMDDQLASLAGADGQPLGPRLVEAVRAGTVTLANALGNGVADDKAIYDYVPKLIEYYLGEHPLLEQVKTYHCGDPAQKAEVLGRLDQLVVKPVDGYGGLGVVIGPRATDRELSEARALIDEQPARWIAQEMVSLSTHPTFDNGRFRPRHIDLRVFVYYGAAPVVVPAALTRVAPPGSMVVNSSRGGGAKDTWLLQ